MKKDIYVYPAIFTYADDGISIEFPDLPGCLPCADTTDEAVKNAKEAMGLHLFGMEEDNDPIPEPTEIRNLVLESNQVAMLIDVFMPLFREAIENAAVKKTLTIPFWLNKIAEENKINFSQVLQAALKERLNIKR